MGHHPSNLSINGTGDEIYFFDGGLWHISIADSSVPSSPFTTQNGRNLYGLGVDPVTSDVYVSDALDYVQLSRIYRYDKSGNLIF